MSGATKPSDQPRRLRGLMLGRQGKQVDRYSPLRVARRSSSLARRRTATVRLWAMPGLPLSRCDNIPSTLRRSAQNGRRTPAGNQVAGETVRNCPANQRVSIMSKSCLRLGPHFARHFL